jgi:prepilin-type N-terminal cleavage/methylation domain-containing protein
MKNTSRGFTLLETMIALAILAITALGTLAGMIAASQNLKEGQSRQWKTALVEARTELLMLTDKSQLGSGSAATNQLFGPVGTFTAGTPPDKVAIGAAPWKIDPNPANPQAGLGSGAVFTVNQSGVITPVAGTFTSCADSTLPRTALCREVALTAGMPDGTAAASGTAYTVWTRVIRVGEPSPAANPSIYAVVDAIVVTR